MNAPARHIQFQPKPGTVHHRVLLWLEACDAETDEVRSACNTKDSSGEFQRRVLFKLWDNNFIERVNKTRWRLADRGREMLALLNSCEPDGRTGAPAPRSRLVADELAPPALPPGVELRMLTSSPARSMTEADKTPTPVRQEGMDFAQHPSRRGNRLYYRDGRVTDMAGNRIEVDA